jgi:eukaryotic-like serine/threonine-protein kinase
MDEKVLDGVTQALSDRYRILREIDRGGMAVVYLAEDLKHDRKVAIKVLLPNLVASLGTERFLREIDVLAKLQHPHILTLIDSGEAEELPYYVMPFVEGQSLRDRLRDEGQLEFDEAVRITLEIADGLAAAHDQGVIHRDIKPSNVLLSGGHAIIADFGIAAALEQAAVGRLTVTGGSLGSPVYMSPEQATAEEDLDERTDVYSLGCILYEMLSGTAPFADSSLQALITRKVVGELPSIADVRPEVPEVFATVLASALAPERDQRIPSVREFARDLEAALPREQAGVGRGRIAAVALATAGIVTLIGVVSFRSVQAANEEALWLTQQLTEIDRMALAGEYQGALALANEAETRVPGDTAVARLWDAVSSRAAIHSDPPGASIYMQSMDAGPDDWEELGVTPLDGIRVEFGGAYRFRLELEGYRTVDLLTPPLIEGRANTLNPVKLDRIEELPEGMVRLAGFTANSVEYDDFFMDRFEVTNREYLAFMDAGGYRSPEYWVEPFVTDGTELTWSEAMAGLEDQTGFPGPSTWRLGTYPEGQADYPVGGVSWYEAAAYARFVDKELPTTMHWNQALAYNDRAFVAPRSNLDGDGPRPVGEERGMTSVGVIDVLGNVREWTYNESGTGRATVGGGWTDALFLTEWVIPKDPLDREETHGIRLVQTFDADTDLAALRERVAQTERRDYFTEPQASDDQYEVIKSFYAYDPAPLNYTVEAVDTFPHWIREIVSFDLPYGERGGAYLYLPPEQTRPLQVVLFWGGGGTLAMTSVEDVRTQNFDFIVASGRAVVLPKFKGAYERDDSQFSTTLEALIAVSETELYSNHQVWWIKDLLRTIDYLDAQDHLDLDMETLAYYGYSWGGQTAPIALALEPRFGVAVLHVGGLRSRARSSLQSDPINFLSRVTVPLKMISGEFDPVFPRETDQLPLYEFLGTPAERKEWYEVPAAHGVPKDVVVRQTLDWFDRYLGEPGS